MKRRLFLSIMVLVSAIPLSGQEGALSFRIDSEKAFSGRIRMIHDGWAVLGAASWEGGGEAAELRNYLLKTPWGGLGNLITRGILKELETPSLSRAPQTPGHRAPGFDTSFEGSPRRGVLFLPPGYPAGAAAWSYKERQNLGVWYEYRSLPGNGWGAGLLVREAATGDSGGWLEENPHSFSPYLVSAGWWGHLRAPWLRGGAGIFWSAAPADPPGFWGRLWGEVGSEPLKGCFSGGISSPRVWTGGGGRLEEQAYYHLSAQWKPWNLLTLGAGFSETQGHQGYFGEPYGPHQSAGQGSAVFAGSSWELKGEASRVIKLGRRDEAELRDFYRVRGTWKPGGFLFRGEVTWRQGTDSGVELTGVLGTGREWGSLTLEAALVQCEEGWRKEFKLQSEWGDEKIQMNITAEINQENKKGWKGSAKVSLRWEFYEEDNG